MSVKLLFIVALINCTLMIVSSQRSNGSCSAMESFIEDCSEIISSTCQNATFIADRQAYAEHCSEISIFWDAPMYNMTILFKNNLTQPYSICMSSVMCSKGYRTLDNGQEVPITWKNTSSTDPTCFKTEQHDQSIMKFRFDAGDKWRCYGTFINFSYRL